MLLHSNGLVLVIMNLGVVQMEYNEGVAVLLHYFLFLQKTDCLDII